MRLFSTEQVSKYHPDKYADQISDAILAHCLKKDNYAHVAVETLVKNNTVVIAGEVSENVMEDYSDIVKGVAKKLNYKVDKIVNLIDKQSVEINDAVLRGDSINAGDQGIMFGYATSETDSYLPFGFDLANRIIKAIEKDIDTNPNTIFKGDAKTQVTVDLDKNPDIYSVKSILLSVCHKEEFDLEAVRDYCRKLIETVIGDFDTSKGEYPELILNPSGTWNIGGPASDSGLTGRKIVCDQYGGYCQVGGGSFSGKDPTKVDRSATYAARKIAVDLVKKYNLKWCKVQLAYVIGEAKPISVLIENDLGLDLSKYVQDNYDLTPSGIIKFLDLYHLDYATISSGCHFLYIK